VIKSVILLVAAASLQAAVTVDSISATGTQALIVVTAPTADTCTLEVSESASYAPLVADVDPALFTGADTQAAHLAGSWVSGSSNTARQLRIGLRKADLALDGFRHSRALAADTKHYLRVTCNAVVAVSTFVTGVPKGIAPEPQPTDSTAWGQLALPEFTDFSKPVIEPRTGLKIYSALPDAWSNSQILAQNTNWFSGGTGYTTPANITAYGTAVATTTNTNTISMFVDFSNYFDGIYGNGRAGYWPFDQFLDLGFDLYGSGTDATGANRTIRACLSLDSGQTCYTSYASFALPSGANVAAGTIPTAYPSAYFTGWGKQLPRNAWTKQGYLTATAGAVTLTKNKLGLPVGGANYDTASYFNQDWAAGTKIFIAGSGATCTDSLCTIASVTSALSLTLVENLTIGESVYKSASLAVIINKTNATGSVSFSARAHVAVGRTHDLWFGGFATTPVTSGDGVTGYPAIFPMVRADPGALYFIGTSSPVVRLISLYSQIAANCTNSPATDCPTTSFDLIGPTAPQFDPTNPKVTYVTVNTNAGRPGLFKVTYTGTWLAYNHPYGSTTFRPPDTSELSWTNVTPASTNQDIRSQILANTNYDETAWPSLTTINTAGLAGPYMIFYKNIGAQDTACWVFAFTASTGVFYKAWRTDDGTSDPLLHFAGCHSVQPVDGSTPANGPAFLIANNNLNNSNTAVPLGGPFAGVITGVYRGGSFDTSNTSLPWPIDNTYDNTCPGGLPQWVVDHGATGNQCVRLQISQPCSAFPATGEAARQPCPYDAAKSYLGALLVGDFIKDPSRIGSFDSPGLMVVKINNGLTGDYTFQRNANFSYCAFGNTYSTPPRDGVGFASQLQHPNGWSYSAASRDSCAGSVLLVDIVGGGIYSYNQNIIRGHFDLTESGPQTTTMIGNGFVTPQVTLQYPVQIARPWSSVYNFNDFYIPEGPPFSGYQSDQYTQSYIDAKQFLASPTLKQYAFDFRHLNGSTGADLESPNQTIGSPTTVALEGGTTSVYRISFTGSADIKRQALNVWAGEKYLIEKSSATLGNTLTDSDTWKFCYPYKNGECRVGSTAGAGYIYAVIPRLDLKPYCWASQINLRVPCAMAGPTQGMQVTQVKVSGPDPAAVAQRWLGTMLMGPGQQYVYSKVLPTPDAAYLIFGGFLTSGYHTALMMAKLPPMPVDSIARSTFVPVMVTGAGNSVYIEFGYDEYGSDGVTKFYCTTRAENCRVAGSAINETTPFSYASEALTNANGYSIAVPALPGHVLYYRVVIGGVAGATQVTAIQ
jgi:hypothetical protein